MNIESKLNEKKNNKTQKETINENMKKEQPHQHKIETNTYETITLMQSIKWCLILTIDEFCNASPTRVDIMRYNLWKKKVKTKTK